MKVGGITLAGRFGYCSSAVGSLKCYWKRIHIENVTKVGSAICIDDIGVNGDLHCRSLHYRLSGKLFLSTDTLNCLADDFFILRPYRMLEYAWY
uniref:MOSC domain-containing protein n=1 Tax=Elaeophora elaphi TaxID=1147741 RepID=A0A0R3RTW9_9BILA